MRTIDNGHINEIYKQASLSSRKRSHLLLHSSHDEKVQRILIAMIKGSYVEPHFHELPNQWEMFSVTEGCIKLSLFGPGGEIVESFLVGPDEECSLIELSPGEVHSVECISEKALMLEVKEGPFDPSFAKSFPQW